MPSPLRRSGSGLLQNPRPGLLPSPKGPRLGPLFPLRDGLATQKSSLSLRPAASLLLASTPGSRRTPEVAYRAPLVACPGGTHTRWSIGPSLGTRPMAHTRQDSENDGEPQPGRDGYGLTRDEGSLGVVPID